MSCLISSQLLKRLYAHLESNYPEEGAGFLLGLSEGNHREVKDLILVVNRWDEGPRQNRFLITPQDMLSAELEAETKKLDLIGVFHSHPDGVDRPSEFDKDLALPWFYYLITAVHRGKAVGSSVWRLTEERDQFLKQELLVGG